MVECMVFGTRAKNSRYIHGTACIKTKHLIHTEPDSKNLQISYFFHSLREE